jgi:hypothetical protein
LPKWKVRFATTLNRERGEFSKRFQNNIIGNFENRLSLTEEGKTIAIAYDSFISLTNLVATGEK